MFDLEIENRRVRLALGELEGPEEDPDPNPNPIGQQEALAEVADGVGDAGLVGVVAGWVLAAAGGPAASAAPTGVMALELLDSIAEPLLRIPQAALAGGSFRGLGIGGGEESHGGR